MAARVRAPAIRRLSKRTHRNGMGRRQWCRQRAADAGTGASDSRMQPVRKCDLARRQSDLSFALLMLSFLLFNSGPTGPGHRSDREGSWPDPTDRLPVQGWPCGCWGCSGSLGDV